MMQVSRRALRLMMFQVFFLRFIARKVTSLDTSSEGSSSLGDGDISNINSTISKNSDNQSQSHILKVYNSSLGCPTAAMHSGMTEEHAAIMTVSNYPEFFQRVHLFFTPQQFTSMLRNAVRISVQRNYTTGVNLNTLGCCKIEKTNPSGESSAGSTDPGPCKEEILWDDVWKMYAIERVTGPYSADKVIEMRKKVSSSKRQFQQQQQYQQQQQQQLQLRNSRAASPCRKSGYASGNNKATNNYNYMLRGSQSSYYRAADNMYPINNGNGRHGSGYGYSQGQGVGTGMRHPYRPKSGISSVSGGGSAAGSVQETATLLLGAQNGSSGMNNNNNNSYNYSNYNNNYSNNNSHSRNRPSQARNAPQKQDIRRTGNSAENLCSLLNAAATGAAPLGAAHSGQSSVNSNNNSSNNNGNNDSNNSNNNSKPRTKFSHKNSTMNNAMSVSGDRVRLHVFYQVISHIVCNGLQNKRSMLIK